MFRNVHGIRAGALLGVLLLCGCTDAGEIVVSRLDVQHRGWDTLDVSIDFARHSWIRGAVGVDPDTVTAMVFDTAYDTLYAGPVAAMPVPDHELGDREPLMIEVCGVFEGRSVCEQQGIRASPKRIRVASDISYPDDTAYERGSYELDFVVERQVFEEEDWERVDRQRGISGYLMAYVADQADARLKVPFSGRRGKFNLASQEGYRDFKFNLRSRLYDAREAHVRFEVCAGLTHGAADCLATVEKRVREKTEADRMAEVRIFVEQAVEVLMARLGEDDEEVRAYIDDWQYDPRADQYTVELEVVWGRGFFFGRQHELQGTFRVQEDGSQARFQALRGNLRAERVWRRRMREASVSLGVLEAPSLEELDEATATAPAWSW